MIEINMPLNREKVKVLLTESKYESVEITAVKEVGIKLQVEVTGDSQAGAKEIKAQLKEVLGAGFYFSVNVIK